MSYIKHLQVSVTEQKQDAAENSDSEAGSSPQATQADSSNGKPDGDDVLMEEAQMVTKMFLSRVMILHSFSSSLP